MTEQAARPPEQPHDLSALFEVARKMVKSLGCNCPVVFHISEETGVMQTRHHEKCRLLRIRRAHLN